MSAAASPYEPPAATERLQRSSGTLHIAYRDRDGTTALADLRQEGCLKARFPRPTGWTEAVMLNSSGGVAGGDSLTLRLDVGRNAKATFSAQAAERFYGARPSDTPSSVHTTITLAPNSAAEWLPQETILFDRSALTRTLEINMAEDAHFLGVETLIFGRALMGETVHTARLRDTIRLRRAGKLLLHDAIRLEGQVAEILAHRASARGAIAMATIIHATPTAPAHLTALREAWADAPAEDAASTWNNILIGRIVAPDAATLRTTLVAGLAVLRDHRPLPRVWNC